MNTHLLRFLTAALSALACEATVFAQSFVVLNKEARYVQTGPTTTTPDSQGAYRFSANAESSVAATAPSFTPPNGTPRQLVLSTEPGGGWTFEQNFASLAEMNATFPNGTYSYTIAGRTVSIALNGDLYPNAPTATLSQGTFSNGSLVVNPAQPLTITISFTQNYLPGSSRLGISVNGGINNTSLDIGTTNEGSGFTQTPLSFTVPPNTFVTGGFYQIELEANRVVTLNSTAIPGASVVAVYSSTVRINLNTGTAGGGAPTITVQPASQTVAAGNTVVFSGAANNATSLQWRFNGSPVPGANGPTLVLSGPAVVAGRYTLFASNGTSGVTSTDAVLTTVNTTDVGRLINLSILTPLTAGESMTMGTVLGGQGTAGSKPLLARAAGPSLAPLGVTGFLADPAMTLVNTSSNTTVGTNSGWGGSPVLAAAFASVGAFAYASPTSRDSAIFQDALPPANYTVQVRSAGGNGAGTVIAELYDGTPASSFSATTPRLINVSVLKQIATGTSLTAGFAIGGTTSKTVLVRAIGPRLGLAPFGFAGVMSAPTMTLVSLASGATIARNSGWGGDPQILNVANSVGAFAVTDPTSRDAMLLLTLSPGNYTAQVSPAIGTAGGTAIVEVYEVP